MPRHQHIVRSRGGGLRVVSSPTGRLADSPTSGVGNIFADAAWAAGYPIRRLRINAHWRALRALVDQIRRGGSPMDGAAADRAVRVRSEIRRLQSRRGFSAAEAAEYRAALGRLAAGQGGM